MKRNKEVSVVCPLCHSMSTIKVVDKDYEDWKNGKLAQHAFPYLTIEEREALITHICFTCQDKLYDNQEY